MATQNEIHKALANKADNTTITKQTRNIKDLIKIMQPEIEKALPSFVSPERFTRMVISAISNTPTLAECSQMSFLAAMMNAAQLGLEPNTPLGQAYLIPFKNKGQLDCQFQIGYRGLIDLVYRNELVQTIQSHIVYENDEFDYELGLNAKLFHKPALSNPGDIKLVYALFKLKNGGYGFEVMNAEAINAHAKRYSKSIESKYSPWNTDWESMAKKTLIKKVLKLAPLKADLLRTLASDESIKTQLSVDMTEINCDEIIVEGEIQNETTITGESKE